MNPTAFSYVLCKNKTRKPTLGFSIFSALLCLTFTETWESNYLPFPSNHKTFGQLISALNFVFLSLNPCHYASFKS